MKSQALDLFIFSDNLISPHKQHYGGVFKKEKLPVCTFKVVSLIFKTMFLSTNFKYHIKAMQCKVASLFQALLLLLFFIESSLRQRMAHFKP